MNYGEIKDHWETIVGTVPYFASNTPLAWANQAVRELVFESHCLEARKLMVATAAVQEYDFPADCDKVRSVAYDGTTLEPASLWPLQHIDRDLESRQGTPIHFFVNGLNDKIGLYPIPSASSVYTEDSSGYGVLVAETEYGVQILDSSVAVDGGYGAELADLTALGIEAFYYARPPEMVHDSDIPAIPAWAHPAIVYYMAWKTRSAMVPTQDAQQAALWREMFMRVKYRLKCRTNDRQPRRLLVGVRPDRKGRGYGRLPEVVDT